MIGRDLTRVRIGGERRISAVRRRRARALVAVALAIGTWLIPALAPVPALAPAPVAAARPSLTFVTQATYDVLPEAGRVAVHVRLTATNHLRDTIARRFFFRTGFLTVLPGTSEFRIAGGSGKPKVTVAERRETYTSLRIDLGANLAAGRSTRLDLTFDLRDPGGPPDRPVRISPSLVTFDAWAFATPETPGSSVVVRLPTGYSVSIGRGPLTGPEPDETGFERWSSGPLATPLAFVADVDADRPAEYVEMTRTVALAEGPAAILIRSWPDDPAWRDRVGELIDRALPLLEREIGVPWPVDGPLAVHEALVHGTGGYAGLFDPADRQIDVHYAAPDGVVLHELVHAWFNGRLVADRWAAEAFASYYAEIVAEELELVATPPSPAQPGAETIPLNAWGPIGSESPEAETYAYFASLALAHSIAERARPAQLRRVWERAASGAGAYPGGDPAQDPKAGPVDWRVLLDLLEEETGEPFDDLWREWVARPDDLVALTLRAAARGDYERSAALAGEWHLPPSIRSAMRAWRFSLAQELLVAADEVNGVRAELEAAAAAAGLTLPATLREAFEGPGGPAAAAAEAEAELAAVDAIVAARAAKPAVAGFGDGLVVAIGLLTAEPEVELATARASFAAGDLDATFAAARSARDSWTIAAAAGRTRIVSAALLFLALVLLAGLLRERRRRSAKPG